MKLTFRHRLFLYFAIIFTLFSIGIAIFEHSRETAFKTEVLQERLMIYADVIHYSLSAQPEQFSNEVTQLISLWPADLRITIIDLDGRVLYDNAFTNVTLMSNHLDRKEIHQAANNQFGTDIRKSASNKHPYLYFAKKYENRFVRVALPYDIQLKHLLKADNLFLYFLLGLFLVSLLFIHHITTRISNSIKKLHDLALHPTTSEIHFNEDELGAIGNKLLDNFNLLETHKKNLQLEKQKLLQHIQISEEGICFMSSDHEVEFYNGLFLQYLNQLAEEPHSDIQAFFQEPVFAPLLDFLNSGQSNYFETQIKRQGKIFSLRANIFVDKSFEIILTNVTRQEKTKKFKQEMTGNIAHELRTPVTSIRAYLETVIEQQLPEDKKQYFILQAYRQTITLSEIIKDMGIIAKLEEAPGAFEFEPVNITRLLETVKAEESESLKEKNIRMGWNIPDKLEIKGNNSLLKAIFRNLVENTIRYAGENIDIHVNLLSEDEENYYFTYYDTGVGVANEDHLNRIFERFYSIQEGRTRDTGGSGLGLAIVKNAVLFHKGTIAAKNRKTGGLEFLFHFHK